MQYNNIKIYYINLDKSIERNVFMEQQFTHLNIPITRISAVDGLALDNSIIDPIYQRLNKKNMHYVMPTPGEIGCYLSHLHTWKIISQQKEEFALVLEDDVLVNKELLQNLNTICEMINSKEIVDISGKKGFYKIKHTIVNSDLSLMQYSTPPLGMTGKIIGKQAAKKLLHSISIYTMPIDTTLQQINKHGILIWSTNKRYITLMDHHLGGSTIQNRPKSIKEKLWRELSRPFYRLRTVILNLLYSAKKPRTPPLERKD